MALAALHCYPLLKPSVSLPPFVSARTPLMHRRARKLQRCLCSQYANDQQRLDHPRQQERLFSNVNQATMKHEPGNVYSDAVQRRHLAYFHRSFAFGLYGHDSVFVCMAGSITGCILLVAGTTVGAGILAIPAVTQEAGFLASAVTCIFCWSYMVVTGLLIAEVNVNTMCELGSGGVSLVSMAMRTLGTFGVRAACLSYLFIHYALLVAYVARSSDIITNTLGIPLWESATMFSLAFGGICYFGSQRVIGTVNGFLVSGILLSFTCLVVVASGNLQWDSLLEANFAAAPKSIPIIALSFVYQNVVPVLCTNLEGDLPKVRTAIIAGTAIPLALFLVWDAVILGTIPGLSGNSIADPLEQLRSSNGKVAPIVELFSFLAIGTSYIGFVLGLSDFLADLLKLPSGQNKRLPYIVTLFPPLVLSLLDPEIFFKALDFAGTYGVLVLFGIFPAAMSWSERYSDELEAPVPPIVPGGKFTLSVVMGGALLVIFSEIVKDIMQLQGLN